MARDDESRWRGYVALGILASLVGLHLWVRSLSAPTAANQPKPKDPPLAVDPDIDPKLPPEQRDKIMRERALRRLMDQQTADLRAQAKDAFDRGDFASAADLYRKCLKIDPANEEAKSGLYRATDERAWAEHVTRGQEAQALGDLETAFFELDRARTLKPDDADVQARLQDVQLAMLSRDARRAEAAERWDDALRAYEQALSIKDDPQLRETVRNLKETVVVEAKRKQRARLAQQFEEADRLERDGRIEEAVVCYRECRELAAALGEDPGLYDRKIAGVREKAKGYEELYLHWKKKGQELMAQEKFTEAEAAWRKAPALTEAQKGEIAALIRQVQDVAIQKEMVEVPAGEFIAGGGTIGDVAIPQRRVRLKRYFIDRLEVNHRQYQAFIDATGHPAPEYWKGKIAPKGSEEVPVIGVTYDDAVAYATWAHKRLPTEEEWEKAARGTDGRVYPWGNTFDPLLCNSMALKVGKSLPMPGGNFARGASPYGCMDMAGNAMEWTSTEAPPADPEHDSGPWRIIKGGSFLFNQTMCASWARLAEDPRLRLMGLGFRCVKDAE